MTVNFNPTLEFRGKDWFNTNLPITPDTKPNYSVFTVYATEAPKSGVASESAGDHGRAVGQ